MAEPGDGEHRTHGGGPLTPERILRNQQEKRHIYEELVDRLGLAPGDRVVDVGSGPGVASLLAAERVGPTGAVWALDRRGPVLSLLGRLLAERGVGNVHVLEGDAATFNLPDPAINRFLLTDALHHTPEPEAVVHHLAAVLPTGARGVVSDYDPFVPERRVGAQLAVRLPEERVRAWLEAAGFRVEEAWRPPDEHYALLVRKP